MKVRKEDMKGSAMTIAVLGALATMMAMPSLVYATDTSEDEIAEIRRPTNTVEIGVENVGSKSAKFGEYNGLNKEGVEFVGNFSVKGGDAYEGGDGTMRWGFTGTDLGTTSREFGATVGDQGKWNLGIGYDELRHSTGEGYQTPYNGTMGGNNFTLPAGFAPVANTQVLTAPQKAAFHTMDIGTTRKNTSLTAGVIVAPQWNIKFDYNHLDQSGAKLMAFGTDNIGGAAGEKVAFLPNPTNYKTDTVNLSLNWAGDKAYMTSSYSGSYFRDGYDRVDFANFATANATDTMTTPPSNDFHQLNLTGGFDLAEKTKVAGGLSYSRNTQNDAFVATALTLPGSAATSSLNGLVVNTHADLKLTDRSFKDLTLSAGLKYDKRDNRTPSNIYRFEAISGTISNRAYYPNTPLSTKKTQIELAADYRLDKSQNIRLALTHDDTSRWCNQYGQLATFTQLAANGPAGVVGYPSGTNCVVAIGAKEDKIAAGYRLKVSSDLNFNAGYSYGKRTTEFDPLARTAMIGNDGGLLSNVNPLGQNGGDFLGFHPYLDENRKQHMFKAGVNWQANEQFSLGLAGRYIDDIYDTQYGWKDGHQWSVSLDAAYNYSETAIVSAYATQQRRYRNRTDLRSQDVQNVVAVATATAINVPQYATDSGKLIDDDFTFGLGFKKAKLMAGKLDLVGDLSYSIGKTDYSTTLNWAGATTGGFTCSSAFFLTCGDVPSVKNTMLQFKLVGTYEVDKASKVSVGYLFQRLESNDYYYNTLQTGFTPTSVMPTNQQTGSYSVNVVSASYIYTFK